MSDSNMDKLVDAGIIPKGYDGLNDAEQAAINGMTGEEIKAIISASAKVDGDFMFESLTCTTPLVAY